MPVLKTKLNNKVKIASEKLKTNKINCNSPEANGYSPVHNKAW